VLSAVSGGASSGLFWNSKREYGSLVSVATGPTQPLSASVLSFFTTPDGSTKTRKTQQ